MFRIALISILLVGSFTSCASTPESGIEAPRALEPPAEMAQLEPLLGEWTGTVEFLTMPRDMAEMFPPAEDGEYPKLGGQYESEWTLGGMFLLTKGWEDIGGGQTSHYVWYLGWDANAGKFRGQAFNDMGVYAESWTTFDAATRTFTAETEGRTSDGSPFWSKSTMTIEDDNTLTTLGAQHDANGVVEMRITDRRR